MAIISALASVTIGLGVSLLIFWLLNWAVGRAPGRWRPRLIPYVFLAPGIVLVAVFLLYPTIRTIIESFTKASQRRGEGASFVGLDNYIDLFSSPSFLGTLVNNLLWVLVVPAVAVIVGLIVAALTDRLGRRRESTFKAMIFLPMAISGVAAAATWRFVYDYEAPGLPQTGILNALWTAGGADPVPWMTVDAGRLNSFLLMVIAIWLQVGFAMVLLSGAIKGVPEETIEAGRLDGASERRIFLTIIAPQIRGTILAVFVTIVIFVMKIFDIIYAMTGGQYNTSVLAVEFYNQMFSFQNPGKAAAVVVVLMIAIVPLIVYQIRSYKAQEELR
ncbi:alpha-glucoside transport system permease protein [Microbacterium sp. AG790]|uniref:carbohydrate ABC transporter permease n=1 Tax=Microbacterium sp. AG790 TaxID=2183995 RepID=UPI000EB1D9E1|nr:sugar ABC transporter permease [Microbacterium sp. AG790]RKS89297.1 alpha-glucoside transport system permease protein [Microbacterium sp. AG790]